MGTFFCCDIIVLYSFTLLGLATIKLNARECNPLPFPIYHGTPNVSPPLKFGHYQLQYLIHIYN